MNYDSLYVIAERNYNAQDYIDRKKEKRMRNFMLKVVKVVLFLLVLVFVSRWF